MHANSIYIRGVEPLDVSRRHGLCSNNRFIIGYRVKKVLKGAIRLFEIHQVHERRKLVPEIVRIAEQALFDIPMPLSDIAEKYSRRLDDFQKLRVLTVDKLGA